VASGNGASWYVALTLWLASLGSDAGPHVVAVPAGLLAAPAWRWRRGDVLLAISSSGELNDLLAAQAVIGPSRSVAITSNAASSIGRAAGTVVVSASAGQRSHTHTRSYVAATVAAIALWAELCDDGALRGALGSAAEHARNALDAAPAWAVEVLREAPTDAIAFGPGDGWAAALETALLLREVGGIPAEGHEAREGATSATFALTHTSLAVSCAMRDDVQARGAERACADAGAIVIALPDTPGPRALDAIVSLPYAVALAIRVGQLRGLDVDRPGWADRYYATVRSPASARQAAP
jgi:fructoselysine-6-P-deglycase FrlB-like protein